LEWFWSAEEEKFMKGKGPSLGQTFFFLIKKLRGQMTIFFEKKNTYKHFILILKRNIANAQIRTRVLQALKPWR